MTAELVSLFPEEPVQMKDWHKHPKFVHPSQTSQDAAREIKPKVGPLRDRVLELLKTQALTDESIAFHLQLNPSTARPRRIELVEMGLVESAGTAQTASGRQAQLWRATPPTEAS